jgi:hypothetical protein
MNTHKNFGRNILNDEAIYRPHFRLETSKKEEEEPYGPELLGFGICPSSGILETRKHKDSETGSVSVLR